MTRIRRVELTLLGHPDGITPDLRQDEGALQSFIEEDEVIEVFFLVYLSESFFTDTMFQRANCATFFG